MSSCAAAAKYYGRLAAEKCHWQYVFESSKAITSAERLQQLQIPSLENIKTLEKGWLVSMTLQQKIHSNTCSNTVWQSGSLLAFSCPAGTPNALYQASGRNSSIHIDEHSIAQRLTWREAKWSVSIHAEMLYWDVSISCIHNISCIFRRRLI